MYREPIDDDDDYFVAEPKPSDYKGYQTTRKRGGWLLVGGFIEMLSNMFKAVSGFLDISSDVAIQKFTYKNDRERFMQDAALEIERLVSGDYDATAFQTGSGFGSGSTKPEN